MNNTFSFSRFARYASTEFLASRRQFFRMVLVTAATQIGLIIISTLLFQNSLSSANNGIFRTMMVIAGFAILVMISVSFRGYHNSMSAPRMMMLPVSKCEKFTYTFLHNIIFTPLVLSGIIILIGVVVGSLSDGSIADLFRPINVKGTVAKLDIWVNPYFAMLLDGLLFSSVYLLGAALFRRAQFILTSVSLIGVMMLLGGVIFIYLLPMMAEVRANGSDPQFIQQLLDLKLICNIITYCAIPLIIAGAWLRFRTLQIKK